MSTSKIKTYTVQQDDKIIDIAKNNHITPQQLLAANKDQVHIAANGNKYFNVNAILNISPTSSTPVAVTNNGYAVRLHQGRKAPASPRGTSYAAPLQKVEELSQTFSPGSFVRVRNITLQSNQYYYVDRQLQAVQPSPGGMTSENLVDVEATVIGKEASGDYKVRLNSKAMTASDPYVARLRSTDSVFIRPNIEILVKPSDLIAVSHQHKAGDRVVLRAGREGSWMVVEEFEAKIKSVDPWGNCIVSQKKVNPGISVEMNSFSIGGRADFSISQKLEVKEWEEKMPFEMFKAGTAVVVQNSHPQHYANGTQVRIEDAVIQAGGMARKGPAIPELTIKGLIGEVQGFDPYTGKYKIKLHAQEGITDAKYSSYNSGSQNPYKISLERGIIIEVKEHNDNLFIRVGEGIGLSAVKHRIGDILSISSINQVLPFEDESGWSRDSYNFQLSDLPSGVQAKVKVVGINQDGSYQVRLEPLKLFLTNEPTAEFTQFQQRATQETGVAQTSTPPSRVQLYTGQNKNGKVIRTSQEVFTLANSSRK